MDKSDIDRAYASTHCICGQSKNLQKPFCRDCGEALWENRPGIIGKLAYDYKQPAGYEAYRAAVEYLKHTGRVA